ncbi:Diphosphomevalonate Decarboxylase [Manis pentadactyla]|nr:Diphosphomevalonate Decarboxylase [Manis pentadactyla]
MKIIWDHWMPGLVSSQSPMGTCLEGSPWVLEPLPSTSNCSAHQSSPMNLPTVPGQKLEPGHTPSRVNQAIWTDLEMQLEQCASSQEQNVGPQNMSLQGT